jgi:hypothetical protein
VGEAAGGEHDALASADRGAGAVGPVGDDADHLVGVVDHDMAHPVPGLDGDAGPFACALKTGDHHVAEAGIAVIVRGLQDAAEGCLVLGQVGVVVGDLGGVPGGECAELVQGVGGRGGVVVERLHQPVLALGEAEEFSVRAVQRGLGQPRHVLERVGLRVGEPGLAHQ